MKTSKKVKQPTMLEVAYEMAKGLHEANVIDATTMHEFNTLCLAPEKEGQQQKLKEHPNGSDTKVHPWRRCGRGKHLVREHVVHVSPSKKNPSGKESVWHEHCANNPSGKDELSYAEIQYITESFFSNLVGQP